MVPVAPFGRTGHLSSRTIFGAAALGGMKQEAADRILPMLIDAGVNHLDTAASYGDSELRLAPWLAAHPSRFFLATKTGERTGDGARRELERSLERLGVDHVDLIQLHNLVEPDEWETAHGPSGVVAAMTKAREEGLVRFIGVTGHGVRIAAMHLRSLERFPFDSVLLPYNQLMLDRPGYRAEAESLLERCAADNVAVQTIKSIAKRRWGAGDGPRYSWYEPLTDASAIGRAVRYVLSNEQLFLNTPSDARQLSMVLRAAAGDLTRPSDAEMRSDAAAHDMSVLFDGGDLERI
jgi:aryl-alcohol dehydrogenase-like predicted oxidoreductase